MQSKRINHLDLVAGLLILWMIYFDHLRSFCGVSYFIGYDALKRLFYFFMAWFYFKSGMFYDEKRNARDVAMRDFHRFVVPFLIGCLIAMAIQALYLSLTGQFNVEYYITRNIIDIFNHGGASWNVALWFLISLYVVKLLYRFLSKYICNVLIALLSVTFSYLLYRMQIYRPAAIGNIPLGLFFYSFGVALRSLQYNSTVFAWTFLSTVLIYVLGEIHYFSFRLNMVSENDMYFLVIYSCLCSIIVFDFLARKIAPPTWLLYIGRNSMAFYVLHYPIGCLVCESGKLFMGLQSLELYIYVAVLTTIILLLSVMVIERNNYKYLNLIVGK